MGVTMPTVNFQADVSVDELANVAEQLNDEELQRFASRILALRARRTAPSVPRAEAELLMTINQRLPQERQQRYEALIAMRDNASLRRQEYLELLQLTQESESLDVVRVAALIELAQLRGLTVAELADQLQINNLAEASE